ncbi:Protein of unknown function [Cnuella takakiae]|uniref:AAA ATPase domain-containing protein n=1 Tax=Cnuella takakiae TaxID=1302690 RepID=A0A1M4TB79_9BACT|nr:DUF3696 domain-containing protein [Cnuella takakiae]OLY90702.1 hypothetical protein BUE76_01405 [Cnuella takakiae]SHE41594.1 Protein of unknown function [Cnuella takakiae]
MSFDSIGIENFRVFNGAYNFKLAPITLLIGANSSGKSSVLKAIFLLQNSFEDFRKNGERDIENPFAAFCKLKVNDQLNLSHFDNWLNDQQKGAGVITFAFPFHFKSVLEDFVFEISFVNDQTLRKGGRLSKVRIFEQITSREVVCISNGNVNVDVAYLWECVKRYNVDFLDRLSMFDREIEGKVIENFFDLNDWEVEEETGTYFGLEYRVDELIEYFLTCKDSDNNLDRSQQPSMADFINILSQDQKKDFSFLRSVFLTKKIFNNKKFIRSSFINELRFINHHDLPLLIYDWKFKADYPPSISKKNFQVIDEQKHQVEQLQRQDLDYLSDYLSTDFVSKAHDEHSLTEDLTEIFCQKLLLATNPMKSADQLRKMLGLSACNFRTYVERKNIAALEVNFPKLLSPREAEDYIKQNSLESNLNIFVEKIILESLQENLSTIVQDISQVIFIPPFRNAVPMRSFSVSDKQNYFSQVLKSLLESSKDRLESMTGFVGDVLQQMAIADTLNLSINKDGDAVGVILRKNGVERNLADYGHGVGQLIPTLLRIAFEYDRVQNAASRNVKDTFNTMIVLEEPETNLHPALQSKLADMLFLIVQKLGCKLLVETHSEYLIRRLQVLTIDNASELEPSDTQIYYFYPPDEVPEGESQVYSIEIEEDGSLTRNFGYGFFDESSRLTISLYQFNKSSKN